MLYPDFCSLAPPDQELVRRDVIGYIAVDFVSVLQKDGSYQPFGLYWDDEKNGNYHIIIGYILALYRHNGRENGNNYIRIGYILGL